MYKDLKSVQLDKLILSTLSNEGKTTSDFSLHPPRNNQFDLYKGNYFHGEKWAASFKIQNENIDVLVDDYTLSKIDIIDLTNSLEKHYSEKNIKLKTLV